MKKEHTVDQQQELSDDDRFNITEVFLDEIVPKLRKLEARNGNLCCDFAGGDYRNWSIRFQSVGPDYEILDFEYDEEACGLNLDL
ncbi:MAG: hypothetical protein V2J25_16095 [Desulfatiglans sp.]|jgi:hypothetical protein|nr:hypothetical protein [Thermodesulfobacteriota bacterium]MEE4354382.1 hypothetical protein [Desulfatiglans sp.]